VKKEIMSHRSALVANLVKLKIKFSYHHSHISSHHSFTLFLLSHFLTIRMKATENRDLLPPELRNPGLLSSF